MFLEAPDSFVPDVIQGHTPGAVVRFACEQGISIMSFHTALDVSIAGLAALPKLLRLKPIGSRLKKEAIRVLGRYASQLMVMPNRVFPFVI